MFIIYFLCPMIITCYLCQDICLAKKPSPWFFRDCEYDRTIRLNGVASAAVHFRDGVYIFSIIYNVYYIGVRIHAPLTIPPEWSVNKTWMHSQPKSETTQTKKKSRAQSNTLLDLLVNTNPCFSSGDRLPRASFWSGKGEQTTQWFLELSRSISKVWLVAIERGSRSHLQYHQVLYLYFKAQL